MVDRRVAGSGASGALTANARFLLTCWKVNLASAMEYRVSFFLLAGMMFLNNFMWLFFWSMFFNRFPVVNGWELSDVMMLWAVSAGGFGLASILFGNFHRIATIVANGQLDVYLTQPKPVLLHVLASRMSLTAIGDFAFAIVVYALVGDHTLAGVLLFAAALIISGTLFMAVMIIFGCCSFFFGNSEGISQQVFNSFVALTTYPSDIFRGAAKILLFSLIPAGFISYLPIGMLKHFDPLFAFSAAGISMLLFAVSVVLFQAGLRRYTSGNAIAMRG
ncbi:ABC transporter permease [Paenibacillus nasutitermitis]|uniref:ABC transporter permease n=1 Tax=Paenibacillus nasutitermitis TaxID=1652958 RepID=A0A917DU61_9BACL|nr:ABC-2 family transporter protein [Paenibacillus nasutitermitis]GGD70737.1 ABC transporter permease [Paenibacillus nasutitermitis]